jgi:Ca2+/H+ antiporter
LILCYLYYLTENKKKAKNHFISSDINYNCNIFRDKIKKRCENESKKKNVKMVVVLLAALVLVALAAPTMAEEISITKGLSITTPSPNSEFDVTLTISGLQIGGIAEAIPDGFAYVSTTTSRGSNR